MLHILALIFMYAWSYGASSPAGHHFVTLIWKASATEGVEYSVYRAVPAGKFTKLNPSYVTGLAFTDTSVLPNHTYSYEVTAYDPQTALESGPSNVVTVVVP